MSCEGKLQWVLENEPQFDHYGKWYMKWWRHFPLSSDEISGWWVASGSTKMECLENAMSGNCQSVDY